jgi:hypothetical protein
MRWTGPYRAGDLIHAKDQRGVLPRDCDAGIYLVSGKKWVGEPSPRCDPLYVGGLTGDSRRFRTRVGDLLIDLFGFYGEETGHSSGGRSLDSHCESEDRARTDLWIGWVEDVPCGRCAEIETYDDLKPRLNKIRPPWCVKHRKF